MFWPEVFTNPDFEYPPEGREQGGLTYKKALADGLCGWGNCHAGSGDIPKNFGHGMIKISVLVGCSATPEAFMKLAEDLEDGTEKGSER